jgi:hypothetical protein
MPVFQHGHEDHVDVPFVKVHGTDDDMCAFEITKNYCEEKEFEIFTFEGYGHNFHMFDKCEGEKLNQSCTPFDEVGIKFRKELSPEFAAEFIESFHKEGDGFFSGYFLEEDTHLEPVNDPDSGNLLSWMDLLRRLGKLSKKNIPYGSVESSYDHSFVITHYLWQKESNELMATFPDCKENVFYLNR